MLPMTGSGASDAPDPPFQRIAIVGFGLIGASIALAVRRVWPAVLIIAVDRKDVIQSAMRAHAADVGGDDLVMAADAELIVLAAPVRTNIDIVGRLAGYVPGEAIVTDVGSTKRETVTVGAMLPPRLRFIGGHPLAGAAVGGLESARADLFNGRPWILTPAATEQAAAPRDKLSTFVEALGARVHVMTPEQHDSIVAYLSHLPQLAASALMHLVGQHVGAEGLALAGRGLRDTTRLASSPVDIWRDITASNQDNIAHAIDELVAILLRLKPGSGDAAAALEGTFDSAARWKRVLERGAETG
jgi:prephenate dehydrogenase